MPAQMTVEATQSIQGQALEFPSASCSQPQTPPPMLTSNTQPHTLPSTFTSQTPSRFTSNTQTQTLPSQFTSNTQPQTPLSPLTSNTQSQIPPSSLTSNTQPQTSRSPMARTTHTSFCKCSKKVTSYAIASPSRKVLMRYAYRTVIDGNNTNVCIDNFFFVQTTNFPKEGNTHKNHSPSTATSP